MTPWTPVEIKFLTDLLHKSTKEIYKDFRHTHGGYRSYNSIQKKIKKLKDLFLEDGVSELFIPHITSERKNKAREEAKTWLKELVEKASDIDFLDKTSTYIENGVSLVIVLSDTHFGKQTKK